MVPAISSGGRTFKAAASYFLHDRAATGGQADTSSRVAWTETFNLATDDPERAWRIMAALAASQARLRQATGGRLSGRKLERPTFAFSLSWAPDERPTKAEQIEAARAALAALGLAEHQALIMAHTDTAHPHVHVLANRVHPHTGKAAPLSKCKLILSQWAQAYEEAQGRVRCRARVENNARRAGIRPGRAAANRSRRAHRREHAAGADQPATIAIRERHAEAFGEQAGQERYGGQRRADAVRDFHRDHKAIRAAVAAQGARSRLDPAQRETHARLSALLASPAPADAMAALTRDRSTFTRAQLERFVARHTPDRAGYEAALAALDASRELVRVGRDRMGRDRFTTEAHQAIERRLFDLAAAMHRQQGVPVRAQFKGWSLAGDQEKALHHVLGPARIAAVAGVAGTGKSTMLNAARQSWERQRLKVYGLALAAEAAEGLAQGSGIASTTIHRRLYHWEQGRNLPGPGDVVVVDEAGMVGSRMMERIVHFCHQGGAKLVLVGDARQLQAIEAGGAFRALCDRIGAASIKKVRRQKADWQKDATNELSDGRTAAALARYEAAGRLHGHRRDDEARGAMVDAWHRHGRQHPGQSQLMLAYLRRDVAALNALARDRLHRDGALGDDIEVETAAGRLAFAVGDRLAFTRNDGRLEVRNGSLGTVEAIEGRILTVRLDGAKPRRVSFSLDQYDHIAHGYAATIHKSQGATVDRAHLFCSPNLDQHAAYVAMTRHRDRLDVHWSTESIPSRAKLDQIIGREAMKDTSYDYADQATEEDDARRDEAARMAERLAGRAETFRDRERTPEGQRDNARHLLPYNASPLALWKLARDPIERRRLFRQQQARLRAWRRKVTPPGHAPPVPFPVPDRAAVRLDLATASLARFEALRAVHAAERNAEAQARRALQRDAARTWQGVAPVGRTRPPVASFGFAQAFWTAAAHPPASNDNGAVAPTPFRPRPA